METLDHHDSPSKNPGVTNLKPPKFDAYADTQTIAITCGIRGNHV